MSFSFPFGPAIDWWVHTGRQTNDALNIRCSRNHPLIFVNEWRPILLQATALWSVHALWRRKTNSTSPKRKN